MKTPQKGQINSIPTSYARRIYRSRTEARWGIFLDCCGVPFQYEAEGFALPSGWYLPDFYLHTFELFLEIKGQEPTEDEKAKCIELAEATGRAVLIAIGQPEPRFQLVWFDAGGEHEGVLYAIAKDRQADAYWLVSEDLSRWMGGGTAQRKFGPMFSGAIGEAYGYAMSEKFAHGRRDKRFEPIREWEGHRLPELPPPTKQERAA